MAVMPAAMVVEGDEACERAAGAVLVAAAVAGEAAGEEASK